MAARVPDQMYLKLKSKSLEPASYRDELNGIICLGNRFSVCFFLRQVEEAEMGNGHTFLSVRWGLILMLMTRLNMEVPRKEERGLASTQGRPCLSLGQYES